MSELTFSPGGIEDNLKQEIRSGVIGMKRISVKELIVTALLFASAVVGAAGRCPAPSNEQLGAIVRVEGNESEGSGVIIRRNLIATAAHVIEDVDRVTVRVNGMRRPADIISVLPSHDLALLFANTGRQQPLPLRYSALHPEETVWAVGYPRGGNQQASPGRFEGLYGDDLQTTASVDHGQSGGGLITCENGEHVLAGIITAFGALDMGDHYERLNDFSLSTPVGYLLSMLY